MSNNQDTEMNGSEDFSQDVRAGEDDQMNGNSNGQENGENGSAEAPGRDDDRYDLLSLYLLQYFSIYNKIIKWD